jgi:hypothetical protein
MYVCGIWDHMGHLVNMTMIMIDEVTMKFVEMLVSNTHGNRTIAKKFGWYIK